MLRRAASGLLVGYFSGTRLSLAHGGQAAANCGGMRMLPSLRSSHLQVCRECFFTAFEEEVYTAIVKEQLLLRGERVAIGASGGKDSTVLAHILTTLNKRYE